MSFLRNDTCLLDRRRSLRSSQTDAEKLLWSRLRNRQLNGLKFFRQYSVGPYIIDFYCPQQSLAIELDGGQHNMEEAREYDVERTKFLSGHGITVVRFWNNEVMRELDGVLEQVMKLVGCAGEVS